MEIFKEQNEEMTVWTQIHYFKKVNEGKWISSDIKWKVSEGGKDFIFRVIVWRFILSTCLIIKECMQHMDFESKKKNPPKTKLKF